MTAKAYGNARGIGRAITTTLPGKLLSHWVFQSSLDMDRTERSFKIALDLALFLPTFLAIRRRLARQPSFFVSLVIAHTINFMCNGHLRGALKWHQTGGVGVEVLRRYAFVMACRMLDTGAFAEIRFYGSLARGELHAASDLDVRAIRKPGFGRGIKACVIAMFERSRSALLGVPMDLLVWDSPASARRMRSDETPICFSSDGTATR